MTLSKDLESCMGPFSTQKGKYVYQCVMIFVSLFFDLAISGIIGRAQGGSGNCLSSSQSQNSNVRKDVSVRGWNIISSVLQSLGSHNLVGLGGVLV